MADPQDAITAARELLPAWGLWTNDLFFVAASLLFSVPVASLAIWFALRPFRALRVTAWYERARLVFPARVVSRTAIATFPIFVCFWSAADEHVFTMAPRRWLGIVMASVVALWLGALHRRLDRIVGLGSRAVLQSLKAGVAAVLLLTPHLLVGLALLPFMPAEFNRAAIWSLAAVVSLVVLLCIGGSVIAARALRLVHVARPRVVEIAQRAAARVGVSPSPVYEVDWSAANVFAFPLSRCVMFTPPAVAALSDEELEALCADRVKNSAEPVAVRVLRLFILVIIALLPPLLLPLANQFGPIAALEALTGLLALTVGFPFLQRRLKNGAEAARSDVEGGGAACARALAHVHELNLIPAVMGSKRQAARDLYDRLIGAGVQPDFPRPSRPSYWRLWTAVLLMLFPMLIGILSVPTAQALVMEHSRTATAPLLGLALPQSEAFSLALLGGIKSDESDRDSAIVLFRAATAIDRSTWEYPANLAREFLIARRCHEAAEALQEARRRLDGSPPDSERDAWLRDTEEAVQDCLEIEDDRAAPRRRPRRRDRNPGMAEKAHSLRGCARDAHGGARLDPRGAASCRFATRPVLGARPGHPPHPGGAPN